MPANGSPSPAAFVRSPIMRRSSSAITPMMPTVMRLAFGMPRDRVGRRIAYRGLSRSRSGLAAVNASLREAAISIVSPVAGLRPWRAARRDLAP